MTGYAPTDLKARIPAPITTASAVATAIATLAARSARLPCPAPSSFAVLRTSKDPRLQNEFGTGS